MPWRCDYPAANARPTRDGRGFPRRGARDPAPRGAARRTGGGDSRLALGHVRRQPAGRFPARLPRRPFLSRLPLAAVADHWALRRADHLLDYAGRAADDAGSGAARDRGGLRRCQRGRRPARGRGRWRLGAGAGGGAMNLLTWVAVVLLGGVGASARFTVDWLVSLRLGFHFPYGILVV